MLMYKIKALFWVVFFVCTVAVNGETQNNLLRQDLSVAEGERLQITRDGNAVAVVVVPENTSKWEKDAAEELVNYIGKVSGARLEIVNENNNLRITKTPIYIGDTNINKKLFGNMAGLNRDGFRVYANGKSLHICGKNGWGTFYGISYFLEKYLNIRWLLPLEMGEDVPKTSSIIIDMIDDAEQPDFLERMLGGNFRRAGSGIKWEWRNRLTALSPRDAAKDPVVYYQFHHNLSNIFPVKKYGKEHPEYFPLLNGKRYVDPVAQLCMTNPDVIRIAAETACKFFAEYPECMSFSFGMNDSHLFCECPNCAKYIRDATLLKPQAPGLLPTGGRCASNLMFHFMTEVGKIVKQKYPDKTIGCLAYSSIIYPPTIDVEDNIVVFLTTDRSQWHDPRIKAADKKLIHDWSKKLKHLGIYSYEYGAQYHIPRVYMRFIDEYIKFAHKQGVDGYYAEVYANWGFDGPKVYLISKLLWDAGKDADKIMDEYYSRGFGPAASYIKAYFEEAERIWCSQKKPGNWYFPFLRNQKAQLEIWSVEDYQKCTSLLNKAREAAINAPEQIKKRVDFICDTFKFMAVEADLHRRGQKLTAYNVKSADDLEELERQINLLFDKFTLWKNFCGDVYVKSPLRFGKDGYEPNGEEYSINSFEEYLAWCSRAGSNLYPLSADYAQSKILSALINAAKQARQKHFADDLNKLLDELDRRYGDKLKVELKAVRLMTADRPKIRNILANPGFESKEKLVWLKNDVGYWTIWSSTSWPAKNYYSDTVVHSGKFSAAVKPRGKIGGRNACWVQCVDVNEGDLIIASMWVKSDSDNLSSRIAIDWFDKDDKIVKNSTRKFEVLNTSNKRWKETRIIGKAPSQAAKVRLFLAAPSRQAFRGSIYFDDACVYRISR